MVNSLCKARVRLVMIDKTLLQQIIIISHYSNNMGIVIKRMMLISKWSEPLPFSLCPFRNVPPKSNSQLWYQVPVFLRNVVYRLHFIDLINETWIFLHFHIFFSIYAGHAFLAIRAKYPSYCHCESIYHSINVMKWLFPM